MKILILAIGKPKSSAIQELVADYAGRIGHYLPLEIIACRDDAAALGKIEPGDGFILLDERGAQKSSVELAAFLSDQQARGTRRLVFFIGGPDGAGAAVRKRANVTLGLSKMTFPHEFVQVLLTEQLYRACSITRGEPYHRA